MKIEAEIGYPYNTESRVVILKIVLRGEHGSLTFEMSCAADLAAEVVAGVKHLNDLDQKWKMESDARA